MPERRHYYGSEQAPPCNRPNENTDHCWHASETQHPMANHVDRVCCFCGVTKCFELERRKDRNHGPFAPEWIVKIVE